jgi:predicted SAM-dependent methyltransferase
VAEAAGVLPEWAADTKWPDNILVHDLRKPLPFRDEHAGAIYGSHVLEHLYLAEAESLLRECNRVLRPGGVLRVVVPDARAAVEEYLGKRPFGDSEEKTSMHAADRLNERLGFRDRHSPAGSLPYRIYAALNDFHTHKWMYDEESLSARFEEAGFEEVRRMGYLETRIVGIESVELRKRVIDQCGICIEGVKP